MTLAAGARLGPYEIVSPLGAGGMGEVYRARDTRLDRTVAVKVLAAHLADDAELRQRFEREARAISSLNHPHVCTLYDVGRHGETDFLVMELLEGESLADRLEKGALPLEQVLRYGRQLADALDRAHRLGIVHRDLKPGNVMVTRAGVKILDFGLAKLHAAAPGVTSRSALAAMPTRLEEKPLTGQGSLLGTFQYMAPEQLEGREADSRTDLFALGCVLYEMATGKKAFEAQSQASLITKIMSVDPPAVSSLAKTSPPAFDRTVRACLAKDPDERWQSAKDIESMLRWIEAGELGAGATAAVPVARGRTAWWLVSAALALALGGVTLGTRLTRAPNSPAPLRFRFEAPKGWNFGSDVEQHDLALSPDGRRLAFVANRGGERQLFVRELDALEPRALADTEGGDSPFWSPDGRSIAYFANGKLKRVAPEGGTPQTICAVAGSATGSWGDGVILFTQHFQGQPGLHRVAAAGGAPEWIWQGGEGAAFHAQRWPHFLPDGRRYLVYAGDASGRSMLHAGTIDAGEPKPLFALASRAQYAAGQLLYAEGGVLLARPFDLATLAFRGEPIPVAQDVPSFITGWAPFTVSPSGTLAFQSGAAALELIWVDRGGRALGVAAPAGDYTGFRLSRDGRRLATENNNARAGTSDLWIHDLERGLSTRLTSIAGSESQPVFSPDGATVAFTAHGGREALTMRAKRVGSEGDGEPLVPIVDFFQWPNDWSADGRFLLYERFEPATKNDLWLLPLAPKGEPRPFLQTAFNESAGALSPEGRRVAYVSDESGRDEVYVRAMAGGSSELVSRSGALGPPRWRPDGRELYFLASDGQLTAVAMDGDAPRALGRPAPLFRTPLSQFGWNGFDADPSGERFLVPSGTPFEALPVTVAVHALRR